MKPYRTDEYVHKLFYETSRFSAFNHQWVVKARINNSQRDPHTVNERQITFQVRVNKFRILLNDVLICFLSKQKNFANFSVDPENKDKFTDVNTLFCTKRTILWHES